MINSRSSFILLAICILIPSISAVSPVCAQSCPGGSFKHVPYPFGFSSGCRIQLNCSQTGIVFIGEFPVQQFTSDRILVNLPAKCDRPVETLHHLYSKNYAPNANNAILLENCTSQVETCMIPSTMLQIHQDILGCGVKDNNIVSCYSEVNKTNMFLNYRNVTRTGCRSLYSGIATQMFLNSPAVSLDVQVVQLGWWIEGDCDCSDVGATCIPIVSPTDGRKGYRCECVDGFVGDGYKAGLGCRRKESKKKWIPIIAAAVLSLATLLIGLLILCYLKRKSRQGKQKELLELMTLDGYTDSIVLEKDGKKGPDLKFFTYSCILTATSSFSAENKLGQGGFGPVYKGKLPEGQEIAVKRLSKSSGQGLHEFKTELILIAKLQHTNLVRLFGCCIHGDEKMLIYEYMPNKSLDFFLFDETSSRQLTWERRFIIIEGIAQGLLYLHKYSRLRIVHRDLKASNILLDENMNPKISDFGTARIFKKNLFEENTNKITGTRGYMAPEYLMEGTFSVKSDVFSFGVLMLEIVSGQRNNSFYEIESPLNLAGYAWELWNRKSEIQLMDSSLLGSSEMHDQVQRCIRIGLLCVQHSATLRPTMSDVIYMLSNDSSALPVPKAPAFFQGPTIIEGNLDGIKLEKFSANGLTISEIGAR